MNADQGPGPRIGSVARDLTRDRVGEVMDVFNGRVYLRPLCGGREWEALTEHVRQLRAREELSVRLAAINARSRGDL